MPQIYSLVVEKAWGPATEKRLSHGTPKCLPCPHQAEDEGCQGPNREPSLQLLLETDRCELSIVRRYWFEPVIIDMQSLRLAVTCKFLVLHDGAWLEALGMGHQIYMERWQAMSMLDRTAATMKLTAGGGR